MADAVLTYNGFPVRLITDKYSVNNAFYADTGFLVDFAITVDGATFEISYFNRSDFNKSDKGMPGYYIKESFYKYKNGKLTFIALTTENEVGWGYKHYLPTNTAFQNEKWSLKPAEEGDLVKVFRLNPVSPFTFHYLNKEYIFKVKFATGQDFPKAYQTVQDYPPVNNDPNSPDYSMVQDFPVDRMNEPTGLFYTINFGEYVTTWSNVNDNIKEVLSRAVSLICWQISWMPDELSKLTVHTLAHIKDSYDRKYYQGDSTDYDELTLADRIVGDLLWQWGYYYSNIGGVEKFPLTPVLPTQYSEDYLNLINQYYNALINFYNGIYYKTVSELFPDDSGDAEERSDRRVAILIKILPGIAVHLLPIALRLEILDKIIEEKEVYEDDDKKINEADVLKILNSFLGYEEANVLLDFLAVIKTGSRTRYEILYKLMDDNRLERYPFVSWFVDDANNRQFYNFLLYEKWKVSKYNTYYVPSGITPNENGLNPQAFFLSAEGAKYYYSLNSGSVETPPSLEYSFEKVSSSLYHQIFNEITFEAEKTLVQNLVIINQKVSTTYLNYLSTHGDSKSTSVRKYGNFHIYQPVSLMGYEGNLDFAVPQYIPIPAFLLFYSTDYNKLKTYDAAFSYASEVGMEIALFFATGGIGAIRHLKHLKYVNKIGAAYRGTLPTSEAVIVWRGAEAGTEILSVSAGVLYSTTGLIANSTSNPDTKELMERLGWFFLALSLVSAGGAIYGRQRAVRGSESVIEEIDRLSNLGIPHGLSPEVTDVLYTIRNTALVSRTLFRNRLVSLTASELGEANHIADLYDNLDDAVKTIFYSHFADKVEDTASNLWFWQQMNKTENGITAARTKAWRDAPSAFQFVRRDISFLDGFVYVSNPIVKNKLIMLKQINGSWVGGHYGPQLFNTNNEIYGVLDNTATVYSKTIGNRIYKQVRKTSITMKKTGAIDKRKKGWHTWIEGISENEYIYDLAYAYFNKKWSHFDQLNTISYYKASFIDGTNVTITIQKNMYIAEESQTILGHFSSILINPKF